MSTLHNTAVGNKEGVKYRLVIHPFLLVYVMINWNDISILDHPVKNKDAHTVTCPLRLCLGSIIATADQAWLTWCDVMMALLEHDSREADLSSMSEAVCSITHFLYLIMRPLLIHLDHNPGAEVEA